MPLTIIVRRHEEDVELDGDLVAALVTAASYMPFAESGMPVLYVNPNYDPGRRTEYDLRWSSPTRKPHAG